MWGLREAYSVHAQHRMEQRGIEHRQVEVALREPHIQLPTQHPSRKRVMRTFGAKTLDVIYEDRGRDLLVVTAAWLRAEDRKVKPDEHSH